MTRSRNIYAPRGIPPMERLLLNGIRTPTGCLVWTGDVHPSGYGRFALKGFSRYVHRASWEANFGRIPEGKFVCHHCDNRPCFEPSHLFVGNAADNNADMMAKGRNVVLRGTANGRAILTPELVREIIADPRTQVVLAREYGVLQPQISRIKRRVTWREAAP